MLVIYNNQINTAMKSASENKPKEGSSKTHTTAAHGHLKTDAPLIEKDEVKQAEEKMRKDRRGML
jgi:hypothetical protein